MEMMSPCISVIWKSLQSVSLRHKLNSGVWGTDPFKLISNSQSLLNFGVLSRRRIGCTVFIPHMVAAGKSSPLIDHLLCWNVIEDTSTTSTITETWKVLLIWRSGHNAHFSEDPSPPLADNDNGRINCSALLKAGQSSVLCRPELTRWAIA